MLAADLITRWWPGWAHLLGMLLETLACLLTAVACGIIVGLERERRDRPAGLRTHVLVCLGSAGFVHLGVIAYRLDGLGSTADFNRLVQSIATGIGFLGAGAIFRARGGVQGITTAASIWLMGAAGAAAGAGAIALALVVTVVGYAALRFLRYFEHKNPTRSSPPPR